MGLGKTIEVIALMAHIAEKYWNYGPHLIIVPASTLYNWQQEILKFCPTMKIIPYWGGLNERKVIRKYFTSKNLGTKLSEMNIVITSY